MFSSMRCSDQQLAASVARALRKDGMLSITAGIPVIAYLEVHGADILGCWSKRPNWKSTS